MLEIFLALFAFIIFGIFGFLIANKLPQPVKLIHWVFISLLLIIFSFVGINTRLISVFQFVLYLNYCLDGMMFGIILKFIYRWYKHKHVNAV